jgi:hypothetical protein
MDNREKCRPYIPFVLILKEVDYYEDALLSFQVKLRKRCQYLADSGEKRGGRYETMTQI